MTAMIRMRTLKTRPRGGYQFLIDWMQHQSQTAFKPTAHAHVSMHVNQILPLLTTVIDFAEILGCQFPMLPSLLKFGKSNVFALSSLSILVCMH